jgi:NTP pyrophosphatase (non-canonical NTP hydrolase)
MNAPKSPKVIAHTEAKHYPPSTAWIKVERKDEKDQIIGELIRYDKFVAMLLKVDTLPMMALHAALGVTGEAGELGDCIKKHIIYNKLLDRKNLVEELGDLRFYMQAVMNIYNVSEMEILQHNADKLSTRYASLAYSDEAAQVRADKKEG